jgi:hypothetical protein
MAQKQEPRLSLWERDITKSDGDGLDSLVSNSEILLRLLYDELAVSQHLFPVEPDVEIATV